MEISEIIIILILISISWKLGDMKVYVSRTNELLEKIALKLNIEELETISEEEALEMVSDLVKAGKKITAIKKYRVLTNEGLKVSKEKIDELYISLNSEE